MIEDGMNAVIILLTCSCRGLFPIIDMKNSLNKAIELPIGEKTMNVSVQKGRCFGVGKDFTTSVHSF